MTEASGVRAAGPLASCEGGLRSALELAGYPPSYVAKQVRLMARLGEWLDGEGLDPAQLTLDRVERFVDARRRRGYTEITGPRGLARVLAYLRSTGVVPDETPPPLNPLSDLVRRFERHLASERGLATGTVATYARVARRFLSVVVDGELEDLSAVEVGRFVVSECRLHRTASPNNLVAALRSLLRFLWSEGITGRDLSGAVPTVASWQLATLPRAVDAEVVARLLASCDGQTRTGRRDRAMLSLLARLGLRSAEVVALDLDDIDWRAGELTVHGKGDRHERLPLPVDVGEALVGYLVDPPPRPNGRALFVSVYAPHRRLSPHAVGYAVRAACYRVGLAPVGPHRLRHSVAVELLRAGASLSEIGQLLRHRRLLTSAIYAKVDRESLRALALPWPGGAS